MKAKFIKEYIDFERGKDPKASMGIGASPELVAKWKEELIQSVNSDKNEIKAGLALLEKVGELRLLFIKFRNDDYKEVMEYIWSNYGSIFSFPSIREYGTSQVFVDIDNIFGGPWGFLISSVDVDDFELPQLLRFKHVRSKIEHYQYRNVKFWHGGNIETCGLMGHLLELKQMEVFLKYYHKNPNVLDEFGPDPIHPRPNTLVTMLNSKLKKYMVLDIPDSNSKSSTSVILYRSGRNWVRNEVDKSVIGAINFYKENPDFYTDYKKDDNYFKKLFSEENEIQII